MIRRRSIVVLACLSMATFGIVLTTLGASLPDVIARFGIDMRQAGALLSLMSFCVLAGSIVFGPIVDRRGYRGMFLFAFAAIMVGLEVIALAPSLRWLLAGVTLIGFSGGMLNGAANAIASDVGGEERGATLNLVGAFFGVGAAGVPSALSFLSGEFSYAAILTAIAATVIVPLVLAARLSFPEAKQPHGFPVVEARRLLREPLLVLVGLMLFIQSGIETTVGGWTPTFFAEELDVDARRAPIFLAIFWLGLMFTRLAFGFVRFVSPVRALLGSMAVAMAGAVVLLSSEATVAAASGVFLLGCGFAPTFPTMFGIVGDRYAQLTGTALSLVITMALVGGMLMPYAVGVLGERYGLRGAFVVVPVSLAILAALLIGASGRLAPARR